MEEIDALLRSRVIRIEKLLEYGFINKNDVYEYTESVIPNELEIAISFSKDGKINFKVIDLISKEEYLPVKIPNAVGEYVGKVKEKCKNIITRIIERCSDQQIFKSVESIQVIEYIKDKYGNDPEFLWDKYSDTAVFRHSDTKKWYGAILKVPKNKLGIDSDEIVEIIDLKVLPQEIENIVDNKKYFLGYHMNKKHWITIILNGSVKIEEIFKYIDMSYNIS